jgi:hypothetical protein
MLAVIGFHRCRLSGLHPRRRVIGFDGGLASARKMLAELFDDMLLDFDFLTSSSM